MPAPLPPDQLTIVRNLIAKGDTAGAIKVYAEATGATEAEAKTEVNNLASRYGLVGAQLPDLFVRRTPPAPKPAPPAEEPPAAATPAPSNPAPVAQQMANVPIEPPAPSPVPVPPPAPTAPTSTPAKPAPPVAAPAPKASPVSSPQPAPVASTPRAQKSSRWGCSSVIVLVVGAIGITWWILA